MVDTRDDSPNVSVENNSRLEWKQFNYRSIFLVSAYSTVPQRETYALAV